MMNGHPRSPRPMRDNQVGESLQGLLEMGLPLEFRPI